MVLTVRGPPVVEEFTELLSRKKTQDQIVAGEFGKHTPLNWLELAPEDALVGECKRRYSRARFSNTSSATKTTPIQKGGSSFSGRTTAFWNQRRRRPPFRAGIRSHEKKS